MPQPPAERHRRRAYTQAKENVKFYILSLRCVKISEMQGIEKEGKGVYST